MVVTWEPPVTEARREEYRQAVEEFLDSPSTTRATIECGLEFHQAHMPIRNPAGGVSSPGGSLQDLLARLELARFARDRLAAVPYTRKTNEPPYKFTLMHLSLFIYGQLPQLDGFRYKMQGVSRLEVDSVEPFLKRCLRGVKHAQPGGERASLSRKRKATKTPSDRSDANHDDDPQDETHHPTMQSGIGSVSEVPRNRAETDMARERDGGVCVVTQSVDPDVCHILPFTLNNTSDNIEATRNVFSTLRNLMSPETQGRLIDLLCPTHNELGSSDKTWNMITLNTQLHRYWSKAYFGLKLVEENNEPEPPKDAEDEEFTTIQVEWRWLPNKIPKALEKSLGPISSAKGHAAREVNFESETLESMASSIHDALTRTTPISPMGATAKHSDSGRPIESGHIITLKAKREDALITKTLIQLQWIAMQMAAFSGAGEIADELDSRPPTPHLPLFPLYDEDEEEEEVQEPGLEETGHH